MTRLIFTACTLATLAAIGIGLAVSLRHPHGTCSCGIACPHPACVFDQAPLTGLNRDELAFLRGERGMPEKRDAL